MKTLLIAAFLAAPAYADGFNPAIDDPVVTAPAQTWTGPYVGLAYGRVTSKTETVECFKLGDPKACDDPIFDYYPEYKVEVRSEVETSANRTGVLAGYRFDMGRVVPGVEATFYDGDVLAGASLGIDLGNLLPYAYVDRDGAALGVEAKLGRHLSVGIRAGEGGATATVSWGF